MVFVFKVLKFLVRSQSVHPVGVKYKMVVPSALYNTPFTTIVSIESFCTFQKGSGWSIKTNAENDIDNVSSL